MPTSTHDGEGVDDDDVSNPRDLVTSAVVTVDSVVRAGVVAVNGVGTSPRHAESVTNPALHTESAIHVLISSVHLEVRQLMQTSEMSFGPHCVPPHLFTFSSGVNGTAVFGFTHGVVVVVVAVVGGGNGIRSPFALLNRMHVLNVQSGACVAL